MKVVKILLNSFFILLFIGCNPLNKKNLSSLGSDDVWSNPAVAEAYVNDIYANFMPAPFTVGRRTDETMVVNGEYAEALSAYLNGTLTSDSYNDFPYDNIRKINIFLAEIDKALFADEIKNSLKGQALFLAVMGIL